MTELKQETKCKNLVITLPEDVKMKLHIHCVKTESTMSNLVRKLIETYLSQGSYQNG